MKRLAGSPLPDTSPTRNEQPVAVEKKEVEQVAADDPRRLHHGRDAEPPLARERRLGAREQPQLDAAGRLELAREPGGGLALLLEPLAKRPALPIGLGQGAAQGRREDEPSPRAGVSPSSRSPRLRYAAKLPPSSAAPRPSASNGRPNHPGRRREGDDQAAGDGQRRGLRPRPPSAVGRARGRRTCSRAPGRGSRRPRDARRAASRAGRRARAPSRPRAPAFARGARAARRPPAPRPPRRTASSSCGVKWTHMVPSASAGIQTFPTPTARTPPGSLWTAKAGVPLATRSISTASPGTKVSPTAPRSGSRRTTPAGPSAVLRSACPAAPASTSGTLRRAAW